MPSFKTVLLASTGNNVGIEVPEEVVTSFGRGKRVPVVLTIDGGYSYRNTIASMGGKYLISFNAETRRATGRGAGDEVEVTLQYDDAPRTMEPPADLAAALAEAGVSEAWAKLAPSHQKAHVQAIESAKAPETRARRVAAAVEKLSG